MWWELGLAVNATLYVAYMVIAVAIAVPLARSGQLRTNRLGAATAAIFFSCGVGHGIHGLHLVGPTFGIDRVGGGAARRAMDWHEALWDTTTAAIGIYYVTLRRTYGSLMKGATMFDDLKAKQRQALEINDNIVQGLVVAEMALALDQKERSEEALEASLLAARRIINDLIGEAGAEIRLGPGDLRRTKAATVERR
jgi:hypothetical protein